MRLQIVGGGKMGEALLAGLIESGWADPSELGIVEPSDAVSYTHLTLPTKA